MFSEDPIEEEPPVTDEVTEPVVGVPLLDLTPNQCRYPVGVHGVTLFCGEERTNPRSSFCDHHHARCWVQPRKK